MTVYHYPRTYSRKNKKHRALRRAIRQCLLFVIAVVAAWCIGALATVLYFALT